MDFMNNNNPDNNQDNQTNENNRPQMDDNLGNPNTEQPYDPLFATGQTPPNGNLNFNPQFDPNFNPNFNPTHAPMPQFIPVPMQPQRRSGGAVTAIIVIVAIVMLILGVILGAGIFGGDISTQMPSLDETFRFIRQHYLHNLTDAEWENIEQQLILELLNGLDRYSWATLPNAIAPLRFGVSWDFDDSGALVVHEIAYGSVLHQQGIRRGDVITHIQIQGESYPPTEMRPGIFTLGNRTFFNLDLDEAYIFTFLIDGQGEPQVSEPTHRGTIPAANTVNMVFHGEGAERFAHISLSSFEREDVARGRIGSLVEFDNAMDEFISSGVTNMVLDLRGNGGGCVDVMRRIMPYFMADENGNNHGLFALRGVTRANHVTRWVTDNRRPDHPNRPYLGTAVEGFSLAVLVDNLSASASEGLVAGIMRFSPNVPIIGQRTHGKAYAQFSPLNDLPNGMTIVVTAMRFYVWILGQGYVNLGQTNGINGILPSTVLSNDDMTPRRNTLNEIPMQLAVATFG